MRLAILSKHKIDAVESGLTTFIAEDLISAIQDYNTRVICPRSDSELSDLVQQVKLENPNLSFVYYLNVERIK